MEAAGCQQNPVTVPQPPGLSYGQKSHFWQITGGRSCLFQEDEALSVLEHRQVSIPEPCPSMAQGGAQCLSDPVPFNLWPAPVGGGTWGKMPSWVTKASPPLPQDGAGH